MTVLGPYYQENNSSIVLRIVHGENSFLLTGDAESNEEQALVNSGCVLQSNVLKVGHHGSDTSTTQAFLDAVSPEYAVISAGGSNQYGHPTETILITRSFKVFKVCARESRTLQNVYIRSGQPPSRLHLASARSLRDSASPREFTS